jgi:hypothetical protein
LEHDRLCPGVLCVTIPPAAYPDQLCVLVRRATWQVELRPLHGPLDEVIEEMEVEV